MSFKLDWHPPEIEPITATFSWDVPYAAIVHEGGVTSTGYIYSARPWTDAAIQEDVFMEDVLYDAYVENGENLNKAFISAMWTLFDSFHNMMSAWEWYWPDDTKRKNGTFVRAGDRDIIDLGNLYDSQTLEFSIGGDVDV